MFGTQLRCFTIVLLLPSFLNWIDGKILRNDHCNKFDADFSIVMRDMRLATKPITTLTAIYFVLMTAVLCAPSIKLSPNRVKLQKGFETQKNKWDGYQLNNIDIGGSFFKGVDIKLCIKKCIIEIKCKTMNFEKLSGTCEMLDETSTDVDPVKQTGWTHYETDPQNQQIGEACNQLSPCKKHHCEDICEAPGFKCTCINEDFVGVTCNNYIGPGSSSENTAMSCNQLTADQPILESGYYWLDDGEPVKAYCDMRPAIPNEAVLSEHRPASMSSLWKGGYEADKAFDGNTGQILAACAHTLIAEINWLQVDLVQTAVINRVKIYNRKDCCSERLHNATIHIADFPDMTLNKQLCASFLNITTPSQIENFDCRRPMVERYVRLTQRPVIDDYLNIGEMQVWGYSM